MDATNVGVTIKEYTLKMECSTPKPFMFMVLTFSFVDGPFSGIGAHYHNAIAEKAF